MIDNLRSLITLFYSFSFLPFSLLAADICSIFEKPLFLSTSSHNAKGTKENASKCCLRTFLRNFFHGSIKTSLRFVYLLIKKISQMSSAVTDLPKWDVFLSFRGLDTRRNFISFLYKELDGRNIRTFKDDKELENGKRISPELKRAIEESKFAIIVVSVNYAASPWCLTELVNIMELENKKSITVIPIFYGVDPTHVRWQTGEVAEQFKKHEAREDRDKVLSWRQALTNLTKISGNCSAESKDDSDLVDKIADRILEKLMVVPKGSNGSNIVGIDKHMKALYRLMDLNSRREVRVVGIWARGCKGRSALAKFVYQKIGPQFESHYFLESVRRQGRRSSHLNEEFQRRIQGQQLSKPSLNNQKVLLVVDDINKPEQLDALEENYNSFGPGSVVIITTQDKQLLLSCGITHVYEAERLRFENCIFRQLAFKKRDISAALKSALVKAMNLSTDCFGCLHGNFC